MTEVKPVIYVAGPYRARTRWGALANSYRAWRAARKLWAAGFVALCPHANTLWMDTWPWNIPTRTFLLGDIALLGLCDAILMLPGWENSSGARGEHFYAIKHGKTIYYDFPQ